MARAPRHLSGRQCVRFAPRLSLPRNWPKRLRRPRESISRNKPGKEGVAFARLVWRCLVEICNNGEQSSDRGCSSDALSVRRNKSLKRDSAELLVNISSGLLGAELRQLL